MITTTEQFEALDAQERDDIAAGVLDAKDHANIDGFGDEGRGYDGQEMAKRLIADGWSYGPRPTRDEIAAALREHGWLDMPADELDCCADVVLALFGPGKGASC